MDEILCCVRSNETSSVLLSRGFELRLVTKQSLTHSILDLSTSDILTETQ